MRRTLVVAIAAAASLALAGPARAATLRGTVVHRNAHAHKLVVATRSGRMVAVRTTRAIRVGRVVSVRGTRIRTIGRARHARLRGTVTFVNRARRVFTLSSRGASVLIRRRSAHAARAAGDDMPAAGNQVTVNADLNDNGDVDANEVDQQGQDTNGIDLEGKVLAIDTNARTLSLSADDDDESGSAVVVHVPDGFDLSQFTVGNDVELVVTKESDGSFTLQKVGENEGDNEGDGNDQGDNNQGNNNDNGDNGDHGGDNGDGGGGD
jgi:hypothetical protein